MQYKILISEKIESICADIFKAAGLKVDEKIVSREELKNIIGDYDGLVVRSATMVDKELISLGTKLKVVGRAGAGVDNIDVQAASEKNIIVMNTPGQNSNAAAELSVALMFALARHVCQACSALKDYRWEKKGLMGTELSGKTLGILGHGAIGRKVATIGKALGMKVLVFDPYVAAETIIEQGNEPADLDKIAKESDFISLHIPKTKETANIINKEFLAKVKNTAYLVNCARGGLVNEEDLYNALNSRTLAGAAFDVFSVEPPTNDNKLIELPNFICTPHLGASTVEAQLNVARAVASQMVGFLQDGKLEGALNAK